MRPAAVITKATHYSFPFPFFFSLLFKLAKQNMHTRKNIVHKRHVDCDVLKLQLNTSPFLDK